MLNGVGTVTKTHHTASGEPYQFTIGDNCQLISQLRTIPPKTCFATSLSPELSEHPELKEFAISGFCMRHDVVSQVADPENRAVGVARHK